MKGVIEMKNAKRLLSGLVSAAMCMSLLPAAVMTNASAEEADKVLLLGDSIASGYGLAEGEYCYGDYISEYLDAELVNNAQPGLTTAQLLEQLSTLPQPVTVCGDGAAMLLEAEPALIPAPPHLMLQSAVGVGLAARHAKPVDADALCARYLQATQAEKLRNE